MCVQRLYDQDQADITALQTQLSAKEGELVSHLFVPAA